MKLSKRSRYAILSLIELEIHSQEQEPLHIQQIAEYQELPIRYLENILAQLRRSGLIKSKSGIHGGFVLARTPDKITFQDILSSMEKSDITDVISNILPQTVDSKAVEAFWEEVSKEIQDVLSTYTLNDCCERLKAQRQTGYMYYI